MNAYAWTSWAVAAEVAAVLAALVLAARVLDRLPARAALRWAWALLPIAIGVVAWVGRAEPAGTRMLVLTAGTFAAMKAIVLQAYRAGGRPPLPLGRWLLFTLVWFGMNPRTLATRRVGAGARVRSARLFWRGLRNAIAGILLGAAAIGSASPWAAPLLMVGLSLVFHFGLFTLLAALLQALGFPARVLFDAPLRARSLGEFWAQRWNRGFAEMTALAVQRPLALRLGRSRALLGSFFVSGLLHEVAISLPVGAGFGLPTCYFVLQGLMVLRERGEPGRWATLLRVVVPLPLVFHPWFVRGTIVPLLG